MEKHFIIISPDGYTYSPKGENNIEPDIENLQVLGVETGRTYDEAIKKLLSKNKWIKEKGYKNIIIYEIKNVPNYFNH